MKFILCLVVLTQVSGQEKMILDDVPHTTQEQEWVLELLEGNDFRPFFKESERLVRQKIDLLQNKDQIDGLQLTSNGVYVNVKKMPGYVDAFFALLNYLPLFSSFPSDDYDQLVSQLINKGFKKQDLVFLQSIKEDQEKLEETTQEALKNHELGFLLNPTKAQINSVDADDVAAFMYFQMQEIRESRLRWLCQFLEQLSNHSRRVIVSMAFEFTNEFQAAVVFYKKDNHLSAIEAANSYLEYFKDKYGDL